MTDVEPAEDITADWPFFVYTVDADGRRSLHQLIGDDEMSQRASGETACPLCGGDEIDCPAPHIDDPIRLDDVETETAE